MVDAGDELVGGVHTRRGGECPKPELWVEAQKEKRLVGGEKKNGRRTEVEPSLFVGAAAGHPFCIVEGSQRHSEKYKVQAMCLALPVRW